MKLEYVEETKNRSSDFVSSIIDGRYRDNLGAAKSLVTKKYYANEPINRQDDDADYLYIVVSGYVRLSYDLEDGSSVLLGVVSPGDGFGEYGIQADEQHVETAHAIGSVCVAQIDAELFRNSALRQAESQELLTQLMARRYRWYMRSTCTLTLNSLASRLSQVLLTLFESIGKQVMINGKNCLRLPAAITQRELGTMARGTRGNVNNLLKSWERDGWIQFQGRHIVMLQPSKLVGLLA